MIKVNHMYNKIIILLTHSQHFTYNELKKYINCKFVNNQFIKFKYIESRMKNK